MEDLLNLLAVTLRIQNKSIPYNFTAMSITLFVKIAANNADEVFVKSSFGLVSMVVLMSFRLESITDLACLRLRSFCTFVIFTAASTIHFL
ncbi:hypothetical protein T4B_14429 [Trichinella pseudospiralis]|uniref:Uncharacterized protein n=2 Tax=Trichinella pseudospiralis TaxID=6337 RepID=A0A0V1FC94_TRIPS|nr:hypothetical protein T4A_3000 [Trichinella pseudospiralis]KRY83703.1 hypothetical protein T4D_10919 [Trichinella pseudospiralis]KRZ23188.1 hypothetical protein T4B_14429 [Trichinella pseudospiralis]KRZ35519.1 hypothetical protein T4C_12805 [Trichinella pseudospiralis]